MFKSKKFLAVALAVVLVFSQSVVALAAWPSFQNDPMTNNGVINNGTPPITAPTSIATVKLPYNTPSPMLFYGVDAETIINNGIAYTLYNGGSVSGTTGGARLAATNLASPSTPVWPTQTIQIDPAASDVFQLSTPYYDINSDTIYAVTTWQDSGEGYHWNLWSVDALSGTVAPVLASGDWQVNTPISAYNDYLFFGSWSDDKNNPDVGVGDGAYYQYQIGKGLSTFDPGTDDFYWTGVGIVNVNGIDYASFGSDSGTLYTRPIGSGFAGGAGYGFVIPSGGQIRSSVVAVSGNIYFTSKEGNGNDGRLWASLQSQIMSGAAPTSLAYETVKISQASTSTPVVSANNYIYVGSNNGFTSGNGSVQYFTYNSAAPAVTNLGAIYTGDPVQSSPIVYSDGTDDYIYFTTNAGAGAGYCYYFDGSTAPTTYEWTFANTSSNPYSVQGMASDSGYLVWGDDGNNLYIAH